MAKTSLFIIYSTLLLVLVLLNMLYCDCHDLMNIDCILNKICLHINVCYEFLCSVHHDGYANQVYAVL